MPRSACASISSSSAVVSCNSRRSTKAASISRSISHCSTRLSSRRSRAGAAVGEIKSAALCCGDRGMVAGHAADETGGARPATGDVEEEEAEAPDEAGTGDGLSACNTTVATAAALGGGWKGSSSELEPVESPSGEVADRGCGAGATELAVAGTATTASSLRARRPPAGKLALASMQSSSGSSTPTSLCSELSPVPPSLANTSQASVSSKSNSSCPASLESGSSANWAELSTRLTSSSPFSPLLILQAAAMSAAIWPKRPPFLMWGTIVAAQHSRTFFTGSAVSRTRGQRKKSVKICAGVSRTMESHMRMYAIRLRKHLPVAKALMWRTKHAICGGSLWSDKPPEPSPVPAPGSANISEAAARRTFAVALAASSRTSATPSPQS
mmetsp:Transcript_108673/g.325041  ORF Transcript_108673/g.325041 Transcript_108673/m.325041 type:complete len:384 (+) Transcript_108673:503-1654(+)